MKKAYLVTVVVGAFLVGYFVGCGDEVYSSSIQRIVYEATEANVTAAGGVIKVPVLNVGQEGGGGGEMAMVLVYGSGRNRSNQWRMLNEVTLSEGEVKINTREYESYYYRVVVIY
ncbi:MAG: hypothetical protein V3W11_05400 [bacterium]